ncbi:neurotrypsin-like [Mercenaria mercenaria]|uniref:neurotrypsin-like n=1 Tax=Mercenaria mercenaria TaxID=6596 RepID=UPI00234E55F2|nr:neurotrypsin-like [Mercenaria mercenaria]
MHTHIVDFIRIERKMKSTSARKALTIILLVALLFVLIVFCVVYIWSIKSSDTQKTVPKEKYKDTTNTDITTEHIHLHNDHTEAPVTKSTTEQLTTTTATTTMTTTTESGPGYKIMLSGRRQASSGKVLIEHEGETSFVCSDDFDNADAKVVCRELGYKNGRSYNLMESFPYNRYTENEPILSHLNCVGNEAKIKDCDGFRLGNVTSCTWFAAVLCYTDKPYELRLVNGIMPDSGMVEMKVGGEWGTLCAIRNFDDDVADILCRSMNFTGGLALDRGMLGEVRTSKVWLPYISCSEGAEIKQSIFECSIILNTENILVDRIDHRNNRYINEYMACLSKPNSYVPAVHCLI